MDANEAILQAHEHQKERDSKEYQDMLDELETAMNINGLIVEFNKIVESYGYDIDIITWLKER